MYRLRLREIIVVALLALLTLGACSGGASAPGPTQGVQPKPGAGNGDGVDPGTDQGETPQEPVPDQQLIVYTGTMALEVAELRPAMDQAEQLIASLGGHVASSNASTTSESQYATVTYRIPAERWSEALVGLRALGTKVPAETTDSENVTGQVVDMDARLSNLRVTETALQSIMDRATTIDDVLKVQRELTQVRSDIEQLTAERDLLASRAALATLEVSFEVPLAESSIASGGWDLGHEIDNALAALVRLGQALVSLLVWVLIVLVPIAIPVAIVVYIAIRLRRRWLRNHPRDEAPMGGPVPPAVPTPGPWSPSD